MGEADAYSWPERRAKMVIVEPLNNLFITLALKTFFSSFESVPHEHFVKRRLHFQHGIYCEIEIHLNFLFFTSHSIKLHIQSHFLLRFFSR